MKPINLILITLLFLLCSTAYSAEKVNPDKISGLVMDYLTGNDSSGEELLSSGLPGLIAVEEFLALPKDSQNIAIKELVKQLGDDKYDVRKNATRALSQLPESEIPVIESFAKKNRDPEVKTRLKQAVKGIKSFTERKPKFLELLNKMYNEHAEEIIKNRLKLIVENPGDMRSVFAVDQIEFDKAWKLLESKPAEVKLTYLLLKVFTHNRDEVDTELKKFPANDILRIAAKTWWPIEIEPIEKDGTYGWTTRAHSIKGNVARNLIRISVKMPDYSNVKERGEWVHMNQWSEVTYIFSFPSYCSSDVVGAKRKYQKPAEVLNWMKGFSEAPDLPRARCDTFRGTPSTAKLPKADITGKESLDWHMGSFYEWAKPLFPKDLADEIMFRSNKYKVPKITLPRKSDPPSSPDG